MRRGAALLRGVALLKLALLIGGAFFPFEVHAQNNRVQIITCESFITPTKAGESHTPIRPMQVFSPVTDNQNVGIVIRFVPFPEDTTLRVIVTRHSPDGQYVDSRQLSISATDTSAATGMAITQSGDYHIKVVNDLNVNHVFGTETFTISGGKANSSHRLIAFTTFGLIAFLLIVLSFAEHFRLRTPGFLRWFYRRPILLATIITFVVLSLALLLQRWEYNFLQHSNLIGVFGIIGIIGTIIGVILTYGQLKLAEDRIENYDKFYDVVNEMSQDQTARSFQFSGSTILPGQVAYGDEKLLLRYIKDIKSITTRLYMDGRTPSLIVPSKAQYERTYNPYVNKRFPHHKYLKHEIEELIGQAVTEQEAIKLESDWVEVTREEEIGIFDAFYFSNGRTAVYAVPLHYNLVRAGQLENAEQEIKVQPVLVGFKTTNRAIVEAFEQNFVNMFSTLGPSLRINEVRDPTSLTMKLHEASDPYSQYLREQFSQSAKEQLDAYDETSPPSKSLQITLITELNELLKRSVLFNEQLRTELTLTEESREKILRPPKGQRLIRLNRIILKAAYPDEIAERTNS